MSSIRALAVNSANLSQADWPVPKVIALSYYDGPTEGILNGLDDNVVYFFKVIAWDKSQDKRLFLLGRLDRLIFQDLMGILKKTQGLPTAPTWIPAWTFIDVAVRNRANQLVELCRSALDAPVLLVLGDDLSNPIEILRPHESVVRDAIAQAHQKMPAALEDWLPRIT